MAGIRDILLISTLEDLPNFERLLGDGSRFGVHLSCAEQPGPDGLAQAFLIGEGLVAGKPCALVLGDNTFYGSGLDEHLREAVARVEHEGAPRCSAATWPTPNASAWWSSMRATTPCPSRGSRSTPKSNYAVTGLYFYDSRVCELAKQVRPSARGELVITDFNRMYLEDGPLSVVTLGRGFAWFDAGTMESLYEAGEFVRAAERAQDVPVYIPEGMAWENGWIDMGELLACVEKYGRSEYGKHLCWAAEGRIISHREVE